MTSSITPGRDVFTDPGAHLPMLDLPPITLAAHFHPTTRIDDFTLMQIAEGVFLWDSGNVVLLERLQALAMSVAHAEVEGGHFDTSDFVLALKARVDLEIDDSFDAEIPETAWHFCLMAAHNAVLGTTAQVSDDVTVESATAMPLPLVSLPDDLIRAALKGSFAQALVKVGVFVCDEGWSDGMLDLQQAAEAVAQQLALSGEVCAEDFVRELQRQIDVDISAHMDTDPPGIDALVFLMAAHNALNSLLAHALMPTPFKPHEWTELQDDQQVVPSGDLHEADTITLYPRGDEPVLLSVDDQQASELVHRALDVMASFYGTLDLPLRERLNTLYSTPRVSTEALSKIVDDTKKQIDVSLTELAGYVVDVDALEIHTARTGKPAASGRLWTWLSQGTPRQLVPPQINRDAYDFVMKSWLTLDGALFTKADGSAVTVNEVIRIGRDLDIGQAIADNCDQWGREVDVAEVIAQEAQANFEITLLNALKTGCITLEQYQQLLGSAGLSVAGYAGDTSLHYGNQHLRIEGHDVPVFGLRTRKANFIYAATEPEGRLFTADLDRRISATSVFIETFRGDLWSTRQRRDGWSWSLLGPAAQRTVHAKLPQPLPQQSAKDRPVMAHWTGQGVYASKSDYERKASEVRLTVPYAIRQSILAHALEVPRPTWKSAFTALLANTRRAFIASQVKEHFTPNLQSSLTHALRIGSEIVAFVLDVLLIAVPGKVKFPGRALLFKVMFLKQLAIDLPTSVAKSKWDEAGEVLVDFFETVLEMGATRKAGMLARSRLDKLNRALLPDRHSGIGHSTDIALTQPVPILRSMLPPVLKVLKDADLSEILRQSGVSGSELGAMRADRTPMSMALAVEASLAMNRVLLAQAKLTLATPRYRELPVSVEWPVVGLLSHHLDICITVLGPDGVSLRRFEPVSGNLVAGSAQRKPEVMLTRYGAWHFSAGIENRNGAISNSLFYYVQPAPESTRPGVRTEQADRLKEVAAELLRSPEIEFAFARAIHHESRPRASVQATDRMLLAVMVEGKDTVDQGKLSGVATRWISAGSERRVPDADSVENLNKASLQNDLALLSGGFGLSASPALTQSAEALYLSALMDLFNGIQGMAVSVRVVEANRSVAVWGNERASQVLVLERRGAIDAHDYLGRLDARDTVGPDAQSANPLSDLVLRLMSDAARDSLGINITEPQVLTKLVMERVLSVRAQSTAQGDLRGLDVTPQAGLSGYVQSVTFTVSASADGLIRQGESVWLEWGHGALEVRAEGNAWRVLSAAGGAGPLLLRSYAEWRILQEPVAALERLRDTPVQDAALLAKLDAMQSRDPSARVYHVWADDTGAGGSFIAFRGGSRVYYRVRPAEAGAAELEVVRADGSGGGVWLRQAPNGAWEAARTLLGGVPDDEHVVFWRPWDSPVPRPIPIGFGIQDSIYEVRFRAGAGSHKSQNRFYPFVAPPGQQEAYNRRLNNSDAVLRDTSSAGNIAAKVEVFSNQWRMPLDITALPFFRLPGEVTSEVRFVNGALIADLIGKQVAGQSVVRRILEPMAGSGFYANYVRAVGFAGSLHVNDANPLIAWTMREIVAQPDRVKHYIGNIKDNLATLAYEGTGVEFDSIALRRQFATSAQAEVFMASEAASRIREDIKHYFYRIIDTHFQLTPDGINIHSTLPETDARAFLAAAFYLMQHNSARNAAVVINNLGRLNLPISTVARDRQFVSLLQSGIANIDHLNYLSHLHTAQGESTVFSNADGWDMFKPIDGMTCDGDLAIVSGHFSDIYITEAQFMSKVKDHVVPFVKHGGRVIIINGYSIYKAEEFAALGFRMFELRTQSTGYLLVVNTQVATDVGLAVN